MNDLIKTLIQIDQKARQTVQEKKELRNTERTRITEENAALHEYYDQRALDHIDKVKRLAGKNTAKELQDTQQQFEQAVAQLQAQFDQNKEAWLEQIVSRCQEI